MDSFLARRRVSTYSSEILLIERRSLHRSLHVVKDFCLPWKSIERGWKGFLHMFVRISCHFKPQGIEACKQGVVVGAVIVERNLTPILGPGKRS